ncbi:uPF0597 protein EUBDOL_02135 [Firmicutes bacterium CAG:170]|nr:uPF0597 protein EUBDOL_02135 [Firmicutes bacterium CAG:170]
MGCRPERVRAEVSGNILKNVKSAVVPNTGGLKGIESAIAAGIAAGAAGRGLQVMAEVSEEHTEEILEYLRKTPIEVCCAETPCILDIRLSGWAGENSACVRIANNHTNLVYKARNDEILLDLPVSASAEERLTDKSCLNVEDIVRFADTVDPALLEPVLERQIRYNSAIAEEGIRGGWGAEIGRILLEGANGDIQTEAKAYAAAGSDARMSGCEMPVVILSGSGNQGITASLPVIRYAKRLGASREQLLRALALSDLITIHQKTGIGRLSAYCGAISAGVGAGAGICYLQGGGYTAVAHTVVNAVAVLSGTICDGAKCCLERSASARSRPAQRRSPLRWTPESWATGCISMTVSSGAERGSSPIRWTRPSGTSEFLHSRECFRRIGPFWRSCSKNKILLRERRSERRSLFARFTPVGGFAYSGVRAVR